MYQRKDNESDFEYKVRICLMKINRELDLDWVEIVDLLGLDCSGDHLRKLSYAYKEYSDYIKDKPIVNTSDDFIKELESKKIELEKERYKYYDQKRELKNVLRDISRVEHIREEIRKFTDDMANIKPIVVEHKRYENTGNCEAVLLASDWHKGLFVNNFLNKFNDDIFHERINKLTNRVIEYGKNHKIKKLHLFQIGDMINGLIHLTCRITNTEDVIQQTKIVSEVIADMVSKFANEFEEVNVYSVRGNHDRVTPDKTQSVSSESFSGFIPWYLEARLEHVKNINIITNTYDNEIIVTNICEHNIFSVHGDKDKVNNVVQNLTQMLKIFPQYIFMGHTHHLEENEIHGCEVIVNSTLSGVDEYAKDLRVSSKPSQKFMIFNSEGRECTYNIKLD